MEAEYGNGLAHLRRVNWLAGVLAAAAVVIVGAGGLFASSPARSQEAVAGTFAAIVVLQNDYASIGYAGGATILAGPLEGVGVVTESSGAPFNVQSSRVSCVTFAEVTADGISLEAPCVVTDVDGDRWFTFATREGGGKGQTSIHSGEGKYAGIAGSCEYSIENLSDRWQTTTINCEWRRE